MDTLPRTGKSRVLSIGTSAEFKLKAMSNRHQSTVPAAVNPAHTAEWNAEQRAVRASFQEGYWQGRDRANCDYATAAVRQSTSHGTPTLLGILVGMAIATLIGGSVVASIYFDGRLNSIVEETETLTETLRETSDNEQPGEIVDGKETDGRALERRDMTQNGRANSNSRLSSGEVSPMDRLEPSAPQQTADPFVPPFQPEGSASDRAVELEASEGTGDDAIDSQTEPTSELSQ